MDSEHHSNRIRTELFNVVVMGVSGCGKSTVAELLAGKIGAHFKDGDELHPAINIKKMSSGIPLTDKDREPWLQLVKSYAMQQNQRGMHCVIACSALKKAYRDILREAGNVWFVHLEGTKELIAGRMQYRTGHFMPEALLDSQFKTLENPQLEVNVVTVDINRSVEEVADAAAHSLAKISEFQSRYLTATENTDSKPSNPS